ncbi:MAG TPA: glycosyltransferase [Phototrophicaceae bacterium]|nr:glycosyltransferase [Phototrophicaceae bacterium]
MKLLFLVSSLDLTQPFSATPAWWQLLKGLYEIGVEVIATPYQGPAIESLWWRAAPNPAQFYGDTFNAARETVRKIMPSSVGTRHVVPLPNSQPDRGDDPDDESAMDRLTRRAAQTLVAPLWLKHLDRLLTREPDIDAVIVLTAPLNHLIGVPAELQRRHHKPIFYYDGDVPASLPNMRGFATGFRIYQGADLAEYTAFISNSLGGIDAIKQLGAREAHPLYYGADPDVFSPVDVPAQDIDVFFYGHGREYRDQWIDALIAEPSKALSEAKFAVRGTKLGDLGSATTLPYLSFSKLREYASRSRINLCITRAAHANVFASSSSRPFELASMGCCIVANPYQGIETWFEPGKEVFVVNSTDEALDRYRYLLAHDADRLAAGRAARERVLKAHTFRHRARELVEIVKKYQ